MAEANRTIEEAAGKIQTATGRTTLEAMRQQVRRVAELLSLAPAGRGRARQSRPRARAASHQGDVEQERDAEAHEPGVVVERLERGHHQARPRPGHSPPASPTTALPFQPPA